jgi:peptidyl-tRNA hydrolase, PTH1 family
MRLFRRPQSEGDSSGDAWLVVGLGNPGPKYATTRHNIGQMVIERWADESGGALSRLKSFGSVKKVSATPTIYVAETAGYMNVSGPPTQQIARFYGVTPDRIVIVHDDLDLPYGSLRLKFGGGHGGHNGLKSLQQALGTPDFFRVRMGIGRPPGQMDPAAYVLEGFSKQQLGDLPFFIDSAKDAVTAIISDGLVTAQSIFHQKKLGESGP